MTFVTPTIVQLLWLPVVLMVFLAPGWLMARRWPTAVPVTTAFLGSAALLFLLVLGLDAFQVPLRPVTVGLGFAAATVGLGWRWPRQVALFSAPRPIGLVREDVWWLLPTAMALGSIALRSLLDPLSGFDNSFRWDYLARLFLAHQSLAGYPPISAVDFESYSWCDGIPPLVPLLNAWIYGGTGSVAPVLVAARVGAEAVMLGALVFRFARLWWGERAGPIALAVFSSSALTLWGLAIGQETGLLALSLVAMLYLLEEHARAPRTALWCWASVAAGIGAVTREYGLAFPVLGILVLLLRRDRRTALHFAGPAALIAAPWYLRNWAVTGNPLYPHPLHGLFPGNAVHEEIQHHIAQYWTPGVSSYSPLVLVAMLAAIAGLLVVLGAIGLARARPIPSAVFAAITIVIGLWGCSIGYTAGGWLYSTRVLLPALALLAVFSGWLRCLARPARIAVAVVVTLSAADAARRSWMLPAFPFTDALGTSFAHWRTMHDYATDPAPYRLWRQLAREAAGKGIIVDHPAYHTMLTLYGGRAVPLVSPVVAPAFSEQLSFEAVLAQLRRADIRYATIVPTSPITAGILRRHHFWHELSQRRPNSGSALIRVYDLDCVFPP